MPYIDDAVYKKQQKKMALSAWLHVANLLIALLLVALICIK